MRKRSNYTTYIREVKKQPFIMIEDKGGNYMSVTNNIEHVVNTVCTLYHLNPIEHNIIYCDSDGIWDGYNYSTKQIFPLQETSWLKAAIKLIKS